MDIKENTVGLSLLTVLGTLDVEATYDYIIEKEYYNDDPASLWTREKVLSVKHINHLGHTMRFYDSTMADLIDEVQHWVDRGE